jgi:hypothetical protein
MVDLHSYIGGLMSKWIRRLVMKGNPKWKRLLENNINLHTLIDTCSDYMLQVVENVKKKEFWKDVLTTGTCFVIQI